MTDRGRRGELLRDGLATVANLLLMGVLLDAVFQWVILGVSHPGAALVVGPVLIAGPYAVARALPAESDTGMFGGNSNWRGPIWMPVNGLIIRALLQYHLYYGDDFTIECPTRSGRQMTLYQVAEEIARRLTSIFLRDERGRRPVQGGARKFQEDPHWRDYLLFYEYFHGDNGAGLGAIHQTGWTGIIARAMHLFATTTPEQMLELGKVAGVTEVEPARSGQTGGAAPSRKR